MNVLCILLIKDGVSVVKQCLESYRGFVDGFLIVDSGSTDGTMELLEDFQKIERNVIIKQIPFKGFANTRNSCLDFADKLGYDWYFFIDDSYILRGDPLAFRLELDSINLFVDVLSVEIEGCGMTYRNNRLIRAVSKLRYTGTIHETIGTDSEQLRSVTILDIQSESGTNRTAARAEYDLSQLEGLTDARSLYLRACTVHKLYKQKKVTKEDVINAYKTRIDCVSYDLEETYMALTNLASFCYLLEMSREAIYCFLKAALTYPPRSGECYFLIYLCNDSKYYLTKAYDNRFHGESRLCLDESLYSNNGVGIIEKEYNYKLRGSSLV